MQVVDTGIYFPTAISAHRGLEIRPTPTDFGIYLCTRTAVSQQAALRGISARCIPTKMTKQERHIARELSAIYFVYGLTWGAWYVASKLNMDLGNVPQWITAIVAISAAAIAATGIAIQYRLTRKRAVVDFFLKTEGDWHLLQAYDQFWNAIDLMKTMQIDEFCRPKSKDVRNEYFAVRRYLNIHELIAVGIKNRMFDDRSCYDFWCGVLIRCVEAAWPVIHHVRSRPGRGETYGELITLYRKWKERDLRAAAAQARRSGK